MNVWEKILRYLLIWLVILLILIVLTVIVYRESFIQVFSEGAAGLFSGLLTCLLMIGVFIYLLRTIF